MRSHRWIIGLTAAFLILACANIQFQAGFVGDELTYRSAAWEIFQGGPKSNLEHPLLAKTLQGTAAAVVALMDRDPVPGMRLASVLAGAGVLMMIYALALKFAAPGAAPLAAALLMCNSLFLVHARLISPEMIALLFLVIGLYFFMSALIENSPAGAGLAGAFLGLSLSAKWIGIWLIPWAIVRLGLRREFRAVGRFIAGLVLFYVIGNAAYFLNHSFTDAVEWQKWVLGYHQTAAELSRYNGSAAWTWFAVPQHLYYARLMPNPDESEMVLGTINPVVFLMVIPALWLAVSRARSDPAGRLLVESALCLYVPWMFVSRPTYFFYALTVLPVLAVLEANLLIAIGKSCRHAKTAVTGALTIAFAIFFMFYPAATGWRIPNRYEKVLAEFNFYKRPVFNSMFCQNCNLYFDSENGG